MYCEMSHTGRSAIVAVLRDFPNRMRIPLTRHGNTIAAFRAARALRIQFEAAFRLSKTEEASGAVPNRRFVGDEKLVVEALEGIGSGRWPNPHKAAEELANRTEAEGLSYKSTVLRLGNKVRNAMN